MLSLHRLPPELWLTVSKLLSIREITALLDALHGQKLAGVRDIFTTAIIEKISALVLAFSEIGSSIPVRGTDLLNRKLDPWRRRLRPQQPGATYRALLIPPPCPALYKTAWPLQDLPSIRLERTFNYD